MFIKSQISRNISSAIAVIVFMSGGGYSSVALADTVTLENQQISRTRGNGDGSRYATEFNHPDEDLVIRWQNNRTLPSDGNPIRDGNVNVRNLTIDANFFEDINTDAPDPRDHYYLEIRNKGVYANSGLTHIQASDTISIKARNDGIYTESSGSVRIEGFKKLDVQGLGYSSFDFNTYVPSFPAEERPQAFTTGSHGIVDNGEGITIHGGTGSEINVVAMGFAVMNGLGNRLGTMSSDPRHPEDIAVGRGIEVRTDKLTVQSRGNAIGAAMGKDGQQFKVNVESAEIALTGAFASAMAGGYARIDINQHTRGLVQLTGRVAAMNRGEVYINFDADGSYLKDGAPETSNEEAIVVGGLREDAHPDADNGHAVLNFRGNNQLIKGYSRVQGARALLEITSTGEGFSAKTKTGGRYDKPLFIAEKAGTVKLSSSGASATFVGELKAQEAGVIDMRVTGANARMQGAITTSEAVAGSQIKTVFSGEGAQLEGNIEANSQESLIELTLSGAHSSLKGMVSSFGSSGSSSSEGDYSRSGNDVRIVSTGAAMKYEGQLSARRENKLTARFSGEGAELKANSSGKLIRNSGTLKLTVENRGSLTGAMENFSERIQRGKRNQDGYEDYQAAGELDVQLANQTTYQGDLTNRAGSAALTLDASQWQGNLTAAAEAQRTAITLKRVSTWSGQATGSGAVDLSGNSLWSATADSTLDTLTMDAGSITSLAGSAQRLSTETLNGTGTFVLDLTYQNDSLATYHDGTMSDYLFVNAEGDGGAHRIALTGETNIETMTPDSKLYFATAPEGAVTFVAAPDGAVLRNHQGLFNKLRHYQVLSESATAPVDNADPSEPASAEASAAARRVMRDVTPAMQNWYLTYTGSEDVVNENGLTPADLYTATVALWRDNDTLLKRLGDLHTLRADTGSWVRLIARKLDRSGEHAFESKLNTVQLGLDRARVDERGTWYFGVAYAYHDGKSTIDSGKGDVNGHELTLYASRADEARRHLDLVARLGQLNTSYESHYGDKATFRNLAASLSAEFGWQLPLGTAWQIEPQAQLTVSNVWGDNFETQNAIKVEQDDAKSVVGRLGLRLARELPLSGENTGHFYAKASLLHEFAGKTRSTLSDGARYIAEDRLRDTWGVLGIGTTVRHGKNLHLYLDAETSVGASVRMQYRLNAGMRYTF